MNRNMLIASVCVLALIVIAIPIVNIAYPIPHVMAYYLVACGLLLATVIKTMRLEPKARG